jgi:hypothetical protein
MSRADGGPLAVCLLNAACFFGTTLTSSSSLSSILMQAGGGLAGGRGTMDGSAPPAFLAVGVWTGEAALDGRGGGSARPAGAGFRAGWRQGTFAMGPVDDELIWPRLGPGFPGPVGRQGGLPSLSA